MHCAPPDIGESAASLSDLVSEGRQQSTTGKSLHGYADESKLDHIIYSVVKDKLSSLVSLNSATSPRTQCIPSVERFHCGCRHHLDAVNPQAIRESDLNVNPASNTATQALTTSASKRVPAPSVTSARALSIPSPGR